ncbi:MAG: hypothetical protein L6Q97_11445, partial [Thermoanaerobaculia bacterium]|nr:hypothetical protein [Thermoanaerobaculia bacterium]
MKNGTAIFLIFLFIAPAGAIAQTPQQTLENWQHRTDSLITIGERIDPVADSAYFRTLLDSLYWTIDAVYQWKEFKAWDKVCPVLFKQLTLTEKRFGIYHPYYADATSAFFNGVLKSREGTLSDFLRPTIDACINTAGNLRMP